jgi:FKBP-type peptidyl-prolyl cis-trans isomerase
MHMKSKHFFIIAAAILTFGAGAQTLPPGGPSASAPSLLTQPALTDPPDKQRVSTAFGEYFGIRAASDLQRAGIDPKKELDLTKFVEAYSNALAGVPEVISNTEASALMQQQVAYERGRVAQETEKLKATGPENKEKGLKFLAENAKKPGVVVLTNGLQYKELRAGTGEIPTTNNSVTMSTRATLIDGTEIEKGEHQSNNVDVLNQRLPPGIAQAMSLMKAGSKWIVYLSPDLAYGDRLDPFVSAMQVPRFGPQSALIWELDLEAVSPKIAAPAPRGAPPRGAPPTGGMPTATPPSQPAPATTRISSSDIVRVPSAAELARGSNIEQGTLEYFQQQQARATNAATNAARTP